MKVFVFIAVATVGLCFWHVNTSAQPLPSDMRIEAPGPDVKPFYAAFSGKWVGVWDNQLDHILIVEKVEGARAKATLAASGGDRLARGRRHRNIICQTQTLAA